MWKLKELSPPSGTTVYHIYVITCISKGKIEKHDTDKLVHFGPCTDTLLPLLALCFQPLAKTDKAFKNKKVSKCGAKWPGLLSLTLNELSLRYQRPLWHHYRFALRGIIARQKVYLQITSYVCTVWGLFKACRSKWNCSIKNRIVQLLTFSFWKIIIPSHARKTPTRTHTREGLRFQCLLSPAGRGGCSRPAEIRQREQILDRSIPLRGFPISTTLKSYHLWHIGWAHKSLLGGIQSNKMLPPPSVLGWLGTPWSGRGGWDAAGTPGGNRLFPFPNWWKWLLCCMCPILSA